MENTKSVKPHLDNNFDAIRLLAAFMVLAGHMFVLCNVGAPSFLGKSVHTLGVNIFFLVGGYLIAQSWSTDSHPIRYSIKRLFRIVPPLFVYTVFAALLVGPFLTNIPVAEYYSNKDTWAYLLNSVFKVRFRLPGVFENNLFPYTVNGSLWVMPVEVLMYVITPIILFIVSFKRNTTFSKIKLMVVVAISVIIQAVHVGFFPEFRFVILSMDIGQMLNLLPYFMLGMLFSIEELKKLLNLQIASLLLILYSCFKFSPMKSEIGTQLVLTYFVFSFAFHKPAYFATIFKKWEFSYGLFLYGFFVQQIVIQLFMAYHFPLSPTILLLVSFVITSILAYFSLRFVEKPTQVLCKKIVSSKWLRKEKEA